VRPDRRNARESVTLRYEAGDLAHKKWNVGGGVVDTASLLRLPPSGWSKAGRRGLAWFLRSRVRTGGLFQRALGASRGIRVIEIAEETRTLN